MTQAILRPFIATTAFFLAAVSPITSSVAQDAVKVQPQSYRVVLDNQKMRVVEYNAKPGFGVCGSGRHSHPAHLTVLLTPAKVRVTVGGRVMIVQMPAGQSFWEPAVTHEVENIGGANVRSLLIEPKTQGGRG